jgi:hypothetical protein
MPVIKGKEGTKKTDISFAESLVVIFWLYLTVTVVHSLLSYANPSSETSGPRPPESPAID